MAKKLIAFRFLPAAWGLHGSAFAEAEINYLYQGQERDERLAGVRFMPESREYRRTMIEIAYRYETIDSLECRRQLLGVEHTGLDLQDALIDLDCEFGKLSAYDAAVQKLYKRTASPEDNLAFALGKLDIDLKFQRITRPEFEKQGATLRNEPWVNVINASFNPKEGINGVYFEFDWNAQWIEFLRINGYIGHTDEQIVDDWFADVCRSHVQTEMAQR